MTYFHKVCFEQSYPNLLESFFSRLRTNKVGPLFDEGTDAQIFELGKDKVLKITINEADAQGSFLFKKKPSKFIVKIFDVFKFNNPNKYKSFNNKRILYGIVAKRLLPLDNKARKFLSDLEDIPYGNPSLKLKHITDMSLSIQKDIERMTYLKGLIKAFKNKNHYWNDFHMGNFCRTQENEIKVIDLGASYTNHKNDIPWLG